MRLVAAALSCVLATTAHAQVRPSQRQEILQRVGETEIRIPTVEGLKATMRIHWATKAATLEIEASP